MYLEVTAEMVEHERKAIGAQISNSHTIHSLLKTLLFPLASDGMECVPTYRQFKNMAAESVSVPTDDRQNINVDERLQNPDEHGDDVDDETMNIQEIVDKGIDHVVKELHAISQSQEVIRYDEGKNLKEDVDEETDQIVEKLHSIS